MISFLCIPFSFVAKILKFEKTVCIKSLYTQVLGTFDTTGLFYKINQFQSPCLSGVLKSYLHNRKFYIGVSTSPVEL